MKDNVTEIYKLFIFKTGNTYYYSSLASIYTDFDEDDIGCKVENLWHAKIKKTHPYMNKHCLIETVKVKRLRRKK